jgi:dTDP-4-amino-4,6-dideoxygalactose transaminase
MYKKYEAHVPVTERVAKEIVTLPLFPDMTDAQVEQVVETVRGFYASKNATVAASA